MAQNIFVMIQNLFGHIEGKDIRILPCPSIGPKQFWTSLHCFGTDLKLIFNLDMVWKVIFSCENMLLTGPCPNWKPILDQSKMFWTFRRTGHQNIFPQFRSPEEIQPDLTVQSASSSSRQQSTARLTRFPSDLLETSVDPQPAAAQAAAQQVNWVHYI